MTKNIPDETIKEERTQNIDVNAYLEELVPIMLLKDNNEYKDDLPVTINGETMMIPRGKQVMIPRKYALNIEQSALQNSVATNYMTTLQGNYEKNK